MPRKVILQYPESHFDKNKEFPLQLFPFPSASEICSLTDSQIISKYQEHNLIHTFCPKKKCQNYNCKLVLDFSRSTGGNLKCPVCFDAFPSRPRALKNLKGNHNFLFQQLYSFCLDHNVRQSLHFLGLGDSNISKIQYFRKRVQSVIIKGLKVENKKLGGGVSNPVMTDELQKGRRRKGNGDQKGHPTIVHGDCVGACDNFRYRFTMVPKKHPGPPRFEQIEEPLRGFLLPNSTVITDGAKAYIKFQDAYPELVTYLIQLNHSGGEWTRRVTVEGERMIASTNKIDGSWSHVRRFWQNHMVSQKDSFRYLKQFEFGFGAWAKAQNSIERILNYMQLDFDISNINGVQLATRWKDLSNGKTFFLTFTYLLF